MANLFDYLAWRGDLTFGNAPLCPVDGLIFSMLPYLRLEAFVPADPHAEPVRLADAAAGFFASPEAERTAADHRRLLSEMASSARYGSLRLFGAQKTLNGADGMQFAAISILLPGQNLFVAFEGTDDTLIGWQEDFRMSYECPIPAQLRAVEYLRTVAAAYPLRRIFAGGHSKGGNLAMYAAVKGDAAVRERVRRVFNNDGPGFCDDTLWSPAYRELRDRITTYLPQSSVVGVLLEHDDNYKIVKSTALGLAQHDAYTWEVLGADFVFAAERTAFGQKTEAALDYFVNELSPAHKKRFTEAVFTLLAATKQDSISGIGGKKWQSLREMMRAYADLPPEARRVLSDCFGALRRAAKSEPRTALPAPKTENIPENGT